MPPIGRGADRPMQVTRDIQDGVAAVLSWFFELENNGYSRDEDTDNYFADAEVIRRFTESTTGLIEAMDFSLVRNLLDAETLNNWCQMSDDEDDGHCDMCMWCQAMILRDWLDGLLDKAGAYRSPYVEAYCPPIDPAEPAACWERNDCGCHAKATV